MLKLYNTLTRQKENFKPLRGKTVTFYQCGPTVYWTQHLGNMRAMVLADLIVRSLIYLGYKVKFVRNYTDVGHLTSDDDEGEDKISKTAKTEKKTPKQVAEKYIKIFEDDVKDLNVLEPWKKPRATKHIREMAKMVQVLIDKDYAYATDLAIYFAVKKFKNYTKLSGQDLAKNLSEAGKGAVSDPKKKNPADFVLWFFKVGAHKNALQTWRVKFKNIKQPTRYGFPGWHLECSAMSQKILGDTLDIHLGGVEHISVHHTNEIAQSESATDKKFVNYWLHNEHLMVSGAKMAKSGGTAYTLNQIKDRGYDSLALRYLFLQAHYRSKQNFTWEALSATQTALNNLKSVIARSPAVGGTTKQSRGNINNEFKQKFLSALSDDFNIPEALAVLWEAVKSDLPDREKLAVILDFDQVFGLGLAEVKPVAIPQEVKKLAEERLKARARKDWLKSDALREQIKKLRFEIEDEKEGYKLKKF